MRRTEKTEGILTVNSIGSSSTETIKLERISESCRFAETQILVSDSCVLECLVGDVMISPPSEAVRRKTGFYSIDSLSEAKDFASGTGRGIPGGLQGS